MMTTVSRRSVLVAAIAVLALPPVRGDEPASVKLTPAHLEAARTASRELADELARLQEDIIGELSKQKERALYRQVDAVLAAVAKFENSLKTDAARKGRGVKEAHTPARCVGAQQPGSAESSGVLQG